MNTVQSFHSICFQNHIPSPIILLVIVYFCSGILHESYSAGILMMPPAVYQCTPSTLLLHPCPASILPPSFTFPPSLHLGRCFIYSPTEPYYYRWHQVSFWCRFHIASLHLSLMMMMMMIGNQGWRGEVWVRPQWWSAPRHITGTWAFWIADKTAMLKLTLNTKTSAFDFNYKAGSKVI